MGLLHRLDADDLKARVEQFNLERFLARFEGIVHRFFRHWKRHRHPTHKSGDRVMFDQELALSDGDWELEERTTKVQLLAGRCPCSVALSRRPKWKFAPGGSRCGLKRQIAARES